MEGEIIQVKVKPNAPKTEVLGMDNDILKVNVNAPPDKGKANKELIKVLSKHFKKRVEIVSGLKSRDKRVLLG